MILIPLNNKLMYLHLQVNLIPNKRWTIIEITPPRKNTQIILHREQFEANSCKNHENKHVLHSFKYIIS